ncbi:MAG: hypothetical protein NC395_11290 [Prevotella sp.]|nr:hypothetical protein [Prevotella sp.]
MAEKAGNSEENVIFSCKLKPAALFPAASAAAAVLVLCVLPETWKPAAVFFWAIAVCGYAAARPKTVTVTNLRVNWGKISVPIEEITEAVCCQSLAGKILRYGSVTIFTLRGRVTVRGLPRAEVLRNEITAQVDLYRFKQTCRQAELAREMME